MDALQQDVRYGTRQLFRHRGSSLVAIVNETAARTLFEGAAVGREFTRAGADKSPWTVLGVVPDLNHGGPRSTAATGCVAALVPAMRAARIDPASSLRAD